MDRHLAVEQGIPLDTPLVAGNRATLLQDGPKTYDAMFAAIRGAHHSINLETYIFEDGEIGQKFADLLLEKQAAGVRVNVIYDSVCRRPRCRRSTWSGRGWAAGRPCRPYVGR